MSGTPSSFEPLDCRDGVPGDAAELRTLARRYADTAAEIEAQAAHLESLTSRSQESWKSLAGDDFVEVAGGLAERIGRATARYDAASRALDQFASELEVVQEEAYDAVRRAQAAEESRRVLQRSAPAPVGLPATPEQLLMAEDEQRLHDRSVAAAAGELGAARRDYARAVEAYHRAARAAAETLSAGRGADGLADDWWDENAGWIDAVLDVVSAVALALVVVAVVIAVVTTGGLALTGAFVIASTVLSGLSAIVRYGLWVTDNGSREDFLWDLAAVVTFGLGKGVAAGARGLLGASTRTGGRVGAARAGRQAFTDAGRSPLVYDLARLPSVRPVLDAFPGLRRTLAAADEGVAEASADVARAAAAPSSRLTRGLAFGDDTTARALTAIHRVRDTTGGGMQLDALTALADTMVVGGVTAPNLAVNGYAANGVRENFFSDQAAVDEANRVQIVSQWSMPLARVP